MASSTVTLRNSTEMVEYVRTITRVNYDQLFRHELLAVLIWVLAIVVPAKDNP